MLLLIVPVNKAAGAAPSWTAQAPVPWRVVPTSAPSMARRTPFTESAPTCSQRSETHTTVTLTFYDFYVLLFQRSQNVYSQTQNVIFTPFNFYVYSHDFLSSIWYNSFKFTLIHKVAVSFCSVWHVDSNLVGSLYCNSIATSLYSHDDSLSSRSASPDLLLFYI